jgi:hypothetical protein
MAGDPTAEAESSNLPLGPFERAYFAAEFYDMNGVPRASYKSVIHALGIGILSRISRMARDRGDPSPSQESTDEALVRHLRARGVRIGEGCRIYATEFSIEPYLVTLGDNVGVAGRVKFLPHNGAAHLLRGRRPAGQNFGPTTVGSNCFIGENALILAIEEKLGVRLPDEQTATAVRLSDLIDLVAAALPTGEGVKVVASAAAPGA